jgi:hypothetical protein
MSLRIITLLTLASTLFLCYLQILSNPEFSECICWNPHGRSWRILKPPVFEQVVIPLYFRHAKYASFMRQVNGWGFKRIVSGNDHNSYYHEMFVREFPQLCLKMQRIKKGEATGEKTKKGDDGAENNDALDSQESSDQPGEALGPGPSNPYQQASALAGGNDGSAMGFPGMAGFTGVAPPAGLAGFTGGAPPAGLAGLAGLTGGAPAGGSGGSAMSGLSGLAGLTGGEQTGAPGGGMAGLAGMAGRAPPGGGGMGGLAGLAGMAGGAPGGAPGGGMGGLAGLAGMAGGAPGGAPSGGGMGGLAGLAGLTGGAPGGAPPGGGMGGLAGIAGLTGGAPGGAPGGGIDSAMMLKFQEALAAAGGPNALLQQHQQQQLAQPPAGGANANALLQQHQQQQLAQPPQNPQAGNNFGLPNQNAASQFGGQNPSLLAAQLQAAQNTQKGPSAAPDGNHNDDDSDDDDLDDDDDNSSVTSGEAV